MRPILVILILLTLPLRSLAADEPKLPPLEAEPAALFAALRDDLDRAVTEQLARMQEARSNRGLPLVGSSQGGFVRKDSVLANSPPNADLLIPLNEMVLASLDYLREDGRGIFERGQTRLRSYDGTLEGLFTAEDIPVELVWVGFVESAFQAEARSSKGALGMWQLAADTASRYGLRVPRTSSVRGVDGRTDERRDPLKSASVAARYLRELRARFGDWLLALAAYNAGEERVEKAIRRGRTRDFWSLSRQKLLPAETRDYVPAVVAAIWAARLEGFALSPPRRTEGTMPRSLGVEPLPAKRDLAARRMVSASPLEATATSGTGE